ncbi:MAG: hypothetical protein WCL02_00575 [bacterium]
MVVGRKYREAKTPVSTQLTVTVLHVIVFGDTLVRLAKANDQVSGN